MRFAPSLLSSFRCDPLRALLPADADADVMCDVMLLLCMITDASSTYEAALRRPLDSKTMLRTRIYYTD
jgi:hypothetical protein